MTERAETPTITATEPTKTERQKLRHPLRRRPSAAETPTTMKREATIGASEPTEPTKREPSATKREPQRKKTRTKTKLEPSATSAYEEMEAIPMLEAEQMAMDLHHT